MEIDLYIEIFTELSTACADFIGDNVSKDIYLFALRLLLFRPSLFVKDPILGDGFKNIIRIIHVHIKSFYLNLFRFLPSYKQEEILYLCTKRNKLTLNAANTWFALALSFSLISPLIFLPFFGTVACVWPSASFSVLLRWWIRGCSALPLLFVDFPGFSADPYGRRGVIRGI